MKQKFVLDSEMMWNTVNYEIEMLLLHRLFGNNSKGGAEISDEPAKVQFFQNALIESRLLHIRNLSYFFLGIKSQDDFSIEDIEEKWADKNKELNKELTTKYKMEKIDGLNRKNQIDKYFAHMTRFRTDSFVWGEIIQTMEVPLIKALKTLDPKKISGSNRSLFDNDNTGKDSSVLSTSTPHLVK